MEVLFVCSSFDQVPYIWNKAGLSNTVGRSTRRFIVSLGKKDTIIPLLSVRFDNERTKGFRWIAHFYARDNQEYSASPCEACRPFQQEGVW